MNATGFSCFAFASLGDVDGSLVIGESANEIEMQQDGQVVERVPSKRLERLGNGDQRAHMEEHH